MSEQTLDDLANEYMNKIDPDGDCPPDVRVQRATAYQLALFDLIFHQLEALTEELRYVHNVLASKD